MKAEQNAKLHFLGKHFYHPPFTEPLIAHKNFCPTPSKPFIDHQTLRKYLSLFTTISISTLMVLDFAKLFISFITHMRLMVKA